MVQEGNSEKRTQAENYEGASREAEGNIKSLQPHIPEITTFNIFGEHLPRHFLISRSI